MYTYDFRHRLAAVSLEERGDSWVVSGTYNELKDSLSALKSQGWSWNPGGKYWHISKSKLTPRKLSNIKKKLGISDSNGGKKEDALPDSDSWDQLVRALREHSTGSTSQGFYIPAMGVDLRPFRVMWMENSEVWLLTPQMDSRGAIRKLPAIKKGLQAADSVRAELKRLPSDRSLTVQVSGGTVSLKGPATYHIKDDLKRSGFRYNSTKGWTASLYKVDARSLEELIKSAQDAERAKAEEKNRSRSEGPGASGRPASPKQKALLTKLIRQYGGDWFDITDGIGDTRPPTPAQIESMSGEMASTYIGLIMDYVR